MRYLIDTHVFLWMISAPEKLTDNVRDILEDGNNVIFLSSISGLEIAIKASIGKLKLPEKPFQYIASQMSKYNVEEIPLRMIHSTYISNLPAIHKDPFDRILICQSIVEKIPLITNDGMPGYKSRKD